MDPLRNALLAGLGVMGYGKDKLQGAIAGLVEKGELTKEQGERVISEWVERGETEKENISGELKNQFERLLDAFQVVTRDEFDALRARVDELEKN